jgi:phage gp36-like protein
MQARFEERDLVQLTDEAGTGNIDAARVDAALTRADAMITGYVARRHKDVALLAGNQLLQDIACDLAFHELWRSDRPDHVKDRHKDAMKRLADISAGTIVLDGGQEIAEPRPDAIFSSGQPNTFGRDSLQSF